MSVIERSSLPGPPGANASTHSLTQDKGLLGIPPPPVLFPLNASARAATIKKNEVGFDSTRNEGERREPEEVPRCSV